MSLLQTGRQTAGDAVDAVGRTIGTARARVNSTVSRIENSRVPAAPVGGRTTTVVVVAGVLALVIAEWLGLGLVGALWTFVALTGGELLVTAGGLLAGVVGDAIVTGAVMGFAVVTGLVSAASGTLVGASRKGVAAAGTVGAVSGGFVAAATVPALAGGGLIGLSVVTENPLWATAFLATVVLFATDRLARLGEYSASLAFVIRIVTVAIVAAVAASVLFGIEIPLWERLIGGGA